MPFCQFLKVSNFDCHWIHSITSNQGQRLGDLKTIRYCPSPANHKFLQTTVGNRTVTHFIKAPGGVRFTLATLIEYSNMFKDFATI